MKTTTYQNRTAVTFTAKEELSNDIYAITKKHNGQSGLYSNSIDSSILSHDRSHRIKRVDTIGGTITFHSHSCNHIEAAKELVSFLESKGLFLHEELKEVVLTHYQNDTFKNKKGDAYKTPQHILVNI